MEGCSRRRLFNVLDFRHNFAYNILVSSHLDRDMSSQLYRGLFILYSPYGRPSGDPVYLILETSGDVLLETGISNEGTKKVHPLIQR